MLHLTLIFSKNSMVQLVDNNLVSQLNAQGPHIKMSKITTATKNSDISKNVTRTFSQAILTLCYEKIASSCQSLLTVNRIFGINLPLDCPA